MPTIYDLLSEDMKQAYPPDALSDQARTALTMPLPNGYPADRAARLAGMVAPLLPRLARTAWTNANLTAAAKNMPTGPLPADMPAGNPFAPAGSGGAGVTWADPDPMDTPDARAHLSSAPAPIRFLAQAGAAAYPIEAGVARHVVEAANYAGKAATGVDPNFPLPDPRTRLAPPAEGGTEEAGALAGGIAAFTAGTMALEPVVGPTAALGLMGAAPETTWKGAAISGVTTALAGKVAGMAGEAIEPLLSRMKGAGVPGAVAAYVVSHMPASFAFGELQPDAAVAIRRITGEPDAPFPSDEDVLKSAFQLMLAGNVMGAAGAYGDAKNSAELNAALAHIAGRVDTPEQLTARQNAIGAALGRATPAAREMLAREFPQIREIMRQQAIPQPGVARQPLPMNQIEPSPLESNPGDPGTLLRRWSPDQGVLSGAEAQTVADRIAALDKVQPKRSDKNFKRWQQRRDALQGQLDALQRQGVRLAPTASAPTENGPVQPQGGAPVPTAPAPGPTAAPAAAAPAEPAWQPIKTFDPADKLAAPGARRLLAGLVDRYGKESVRVTTEPDGRKTISVTPELAAKFKPREAAPEAPATPAAPVAPVGAESEASGARSEPAPAANVEAPTSAAEAPQSVVMNGHKWTLERTDKGGTITVTKPDGTLAASESHPTYEAAQTAFAQRVEKGRHVEANPAPKKPALARNEIPTPAKMALLTDAELEAHARDAIKRWKALKDDPQAAAPKVKAWKDAANAAAAEIRARREAPVAETPKAETPEERVPEAPREVVTEDGTRFGAHENANGTGTATVYGPKGDLISSTEHPTLESAQAEAKRQADRRSDLPAAPEAVPESKPEPPPAPSAPKPKVPVEEPVAEEVAAEEPPAERNPHEHTVKKVKNGYIVLDAEGGDTRRGNTGVFRTKESAQEAAARFEEISRRRAGGENGPLADNNLGKFKAGDRVLIPRQTNRKSKATKSRGEIIGVEISPTGKFMYNVRVQSGKKTWSQHMVEESEVRRRPQPDRRPLTEKHAGFLKRFAAATEGDPAKVRAEVARMNAEMDALPQGDYKTPEERTKAMARYRQLRTRIGLVSDSADERAIHQSAAAAEERGVAQASDLVDLANSGEFASGSEMGRFTGLYPDGANVDARKLREDWGHLGQGVHLVDQAQALITDPAATPESIAAHRDYFDKAQSVEDALTYFEGDNAKDVGQMVHDAIYPDSPEAIARAESAERFDPNEIETNAARVPGSRATTANVPTTTGGLQKQRAVAIPRADLSRLPRASFPAGYTPPGDVSILERLRGGGKTFADNVSGALKEIVALANPLHLATRDEASRRGVDVFMEEKGRLEKFVKPTANQIAIELFWETVPEETRMDFYDRIQHGLPQDPVLAPFAEAYSKMLNDVHAEISKFREGAAYLQNFFPQMWKNPDAAGKFFAGKRTGEGTRSFLKERFYADKRAGMDAGLIPLTMNPEREMQLYCANAAKFIMYQRFLKRTGSANKFFEGERGSGLLHYNPVGSDMPDGHAKLNPRWAQVYLNPELPFSEYVDKSVHEALQQSISNIGATAERKMRIGGGMLGYSKAAPGRAGEIVTKSATPLDVLAHELGHAMDSKYGMREAFIRNSTPAEKVELRALADLRWEGEKVPAGYKTYVRKGAEKMAAIVQAYVHMPERFKEVAPLTYKKFQKFLGAYPELSPLLNVKRSMVHEEIEGSLRAPGMIVGGYYSAPEGLARILNNHESRDFITASRWGRGLMAVKNNLTMLELGLSGFHATGVTLLAGMHMMSTGAGDILRGKPLEGLGKMGRGMVPGWAAAEYAKAGYREIAAEGPGLDSAFRGGLSMQVNPEYKVGAIDRLLKHGRIAASAQMPMEKRAQSLAVAAANTPMAVINAPMRLLTDYYIPQVKLGAYMDELSTEMARRAKDLATGKVTQTELERRTWANIDDRFGMLNYDNLFMHRTLKSSLMLLTRAYGWAHGTQRALGGAAFIDLPRAIKEGATGKAPDFTPRMRFALAMTFQTMAYGALYHWAHTGRPPQKLEDYLEPENGAKDAAGKAIRVTLPTYMKDVRGWTTDPIKTEFGRISDGRGMSTLGHGGKLSSLVTDVLDFLENQTYRGPMRNPKDPAYKQAQAVMNYYLTKHTPFSIQNVDKMKGKATTEEKAESFFGLTRAVQHKESPAPAPIRLHRSLPKPRTSLYRQAGSR